MRALPLLTLTLLAAGCAVEPPSGPPFVLVTVDGVGSAGLAPLMDDGRVVQVEADESAPTWALMAALVTGDEPPASIDGQPPRVPGAAETLLESATAHGLETAAFLSDTVLTEESGLLQGAFHGYDGPTSTIAAEGDVLAWVEREAIEYIESKLPRPMEDAPAVWIHLDLVGQEIEAARSRVDELSTRLANQFSELPEAIVAFVALPTATAPSAIVVRGGAVAPSRSSLPLSIVDVAPTLAGLAGFTQTEGARPIGTGRDRSAELTR